MPRICHFACVAAALFAAASLSSCGRKDADSKKEEADISAPAPETPAKADTAFPPGPATTNSLGNVLVGKDKLPPSPASEEEKDAVSGKVAELMKARRDALRRSALAAEKLASRGRALEASDNPAIQGAVKLVNDRTAALAAAKATLADAEASLTSARKELEKAFATDPVWAEFKAEADAIRKEEDDLRARLQIEMANAHKRGFHIRPPSSSPAPVGASPSPSPASPSPASASPASSESTPSSRPEQAGASPAGHPAQPGTETL